MDWITNNWQSLAAGAIVVLTAVVFVVRFFRQRKSGAKPPCGVHCDCPRAKKKEDR
jgi:hypothetical protein